MPHQLQGAYNESFEIYVDYESRLKIVRGTIKGHLLNTFGWTLEEIGKYYAGMWRQIHNHHRRKSLE